MQAVDLFCRLSLNLALTLWVKRRLENRIEAEKQRMIERAKADVNREAGLYDFLEEYFVKLNEGLKGFTDLCSERNLALDNKTFMPMYSAASGKWGEFTTYSSPKEALALNEEFLNHLSALKEVIDRLTIALSISSGERARRQKVFEKYISLATSQKDKMIAVYRAKYAA
jgi:hypothetical protein